VNKKKVPPREVALAKARMKAFQANPKAHTYQDET
jgi:hypothetical protein